MPSHVDHINSLHRQMYRNAGLPVPEHLNGSTEQERYEAERQLPREDRTQQQEKHRE